MRFCSACPRHLVPVCKERLGKAWEQIPRTVAHVCCLLQCGGGGGGSSTSSKQRQLRPYYDYYDFKFRDDVRASRRGNLLVEGLPIAARYFYSSFILLRSRGFPAERSVARDRRRKRRTVGRLEERYYASRSLARCPRGVCATRSLQTHILRNVFVVDTHATRPSLTKNSTKWKRVTTARRAAHAAARARHGLHVTVGTAG